MICARACGHCEGGSGQGSPGQKGGRRIARVACSIGEGSSCWPQNRGELLERRRTGPLQGERSGRVRRGRGWWWWWGNRRQGFDGRDLPWLSGISISLKGCWLTWLVVRRL